MSTHSPPYITPKTSHMNKNSGRPAVSFKHHGDDATNKLLGCKLFFIFL